MAWYEDLLNDQITAAAHSGSHARLLAGPGTGKTFTLTRRICFLINEEKVPAESILAVTFTRAAARELRQRVASELGDELNPTISTLHSFALSQLLRNEATITSLPQPLRIADDWEERNIVVEDLKAMLDLATVRETEELLNQLSADWQSLTADEDNWQDRQANPRFLGAWSEHRQIYGYTLRAELVYQLKQALEQRGDFKFGQPLKHVVIDEYQDLNRCDLAVIQQIETRGVELFVAGDDDQSIYGFRKAHPEGIRRFPMDYSKVEELELEICMRCDRKILDIGLFVAEQDFRRIKKNIRNDANSAEGEVAFLRFNDQYSEASGIAKLCSELTRSLELKPSDILILLRTDSRGVVSSLIREKLEEANVPVAPPLNASSPMDEGDGRAFLAFMRLATNLDDSLAWRSLFITWCDGVGVKATDALYDLARQRGETFAKVVLAAAENDKILPATHRSRLRKAIGNVRTQLERVFPVEILQESDSSEELMEVMRCAATCFDSDMTDVLQKLQRVIQLSGATTIEGLVRGVTADNEDIEQELDDNKVNILTMHRAKGLTAEAVIIAAAEDEQIPGRASGEEVDDERRLLYVSLTRARHHLFVTYCDRRTGRQQHTGRDSGNPSRSLTRFLVGSPHTARNGGVFVKNFGAAEND